MTSPYFTHPLTGQPQAAKKRKGKAAEGQAWGTPTGEELAKLLDTIQHAVDGALVRRSEAIALLSDCHALLLRCQAALPAATTDNRKEAAA